MKTYRKDYIGEYFIQSRAQDKTIITEKREWVPNTIPAFSHTGHAVIIGNGPSRAGLPLHYLTNHHGGHLGKKKLTTYGCNALFRDAAPNFLVATSYGICQEIVDSGYADEHVVLTHAEQVVKFPGKYHLIPHDNYWNAGATAAWLACFDGHKIVYLMGFDNQIEPGKNLNVYAGTPGYNAADYGDVNDALWISTMYSVFEMYSDVDFVWVNPTIMPEQWKYAQNLRQIDLRHFIYDADLGV